MRAGREARRTASRAGNSRVLGTVARIGFAASGLMHLLMGYLAIRVARHQGGESDQSGAFAQVAKLPGGTVILWVAVTGLAALALWYLLQAGLGIGSSSKKRWAHSLALLGNGVAYAALASTALSLVLRNPTDSSSSSSQASGTILSLPGGQWLLILVGVITACVGGYFVYKGARRKFRDDLVMPAGPAGKAVAALGITGHIAKGIAIFTLGVLFVVAAVKVNPEDAAGLDGALKALTALPFGEGILIFIGVGLGAYGLYCFARAWLARL